MVDKEQNPQGSPEPRSLRDIVDGMPTPTSTAETLALLVALEGIEMEEGRSIPEESKEVLEAVFRPKED